MSKTIITTNNSSQYLEYESDKGVTRLKSVTRETPRCPINKIMRIDMLVGTPYQTTYEITEEQLDKMLNGEFDPAEYDKQMEAIFNEQYYEQVKLTFSSCICTHLKYRLKPRIPFLMEALVMMTKK